MSTNDVPGYNPANKDVLALGAWAEHRDGSLIFVEAVEAGHVVYCMFDMAPTPPVEYRDSMMEAGFESQFSWDPTKKGSEQWTWHDKTPFPWERIMGSFPAGQKDVSADATITAARRVAESLNLRAGAIMERQNIAPTLQRAATKIMEGFKEAIEALAK